MLSPLFDWTKTIHIVRGLPGSGKSTLALKLVGSRDRVIENDDFWLLPNGKSTPISYLESHRAGVGGESDRWNDVLNYAYEQKMTHIAAHWCWAETFRRLRHYNEVAVANVFAKREWVFGYVNEAMKLGINVKIHQPSTNWAKDASLCVTKNVHNVPLEAIERMEAQWEDLHQNEIDKMIEIAKRYFEESDCG